METKNAYIIACSIIIASCIIAFSVHTPKENVPGPAAKSPVAAPTAAPAKEAPAKTPEQKLIGKWREAATWGSLEVSPDGSATFSSPPNSIRCRWTLPQEGKFQTETIAPKEGAPGIFGDPSKARVWSYSFKGDDQLTLTFKSSDASQGGDEKLNYMRASDTPGSMK